METRLTLPAPRVTSRGGSYFTAGKNPRPIASTFAAVVNGVHHPQIPYREPSLRNAVSAFLAGLKDGSPAARHPGRPSPGQHAPALAALQRHPLWSSGIRVVEAPYHLLLEPLQLAGSVDAILQAENGSVSLLQLYCCPHREKLEPAVRAELGAAIAAYNDSRIGLVDHAIALFLVPHEAVIQHFAPDHCLGTWVDTVDAFRQRWQQPDRSATAPDAPDHDAPVCPAGP